MNKKVFRNMIEEFVLTMFTGSFIAGEEPSTSRDAEVAMAIGGGILCKPFKNDDYRLLIKRDQPFKKFEVQLVRAILEELTNVYKYNIEELAYNKSLQQYALEKAICKSVSEKSYETILDLIYELNLWANRTYEGNKPTFGFIISPRRYTENNSSSIHFSKILENDFSALLCDGINGCMFLNGKGKLIGYIELPNTTDENTYAPYDYIRLARACKNGRVGVALSESGDLLIFSEQQLVFAKRHGFWSSYSHEQIIDTLSDTNNPAVKEAVYLTALDVSFAGTGGCLCYAKNDQWRNVLQHININDILEEKFYNEKLSQSYNLLDIVEVDDNVEEALDFETSISTNKCIKVASLRKIINGYKFHELGRKLRSQLLGIDGATVIDSEGNIITIGAIVEIQAGSTGGGRLAAAKTLAQYGVSAKISMDNTIQFFSYDARNQKVKNLLSI